VKPDFTLTDENAQAIAELCLRLDGLPLAIELAAARIRLYSPQALRQRLGTRLKLLQGGARDLPQRQKTLRDTIDWSYELLDANEKILFDVFSVFSGSTIESVESVVSKIDLLGESELEIVDVLISLADKSLIRLFDSTAGEPRLRMLETIREFAEERLESNPELHNAARQAHATYFAEFAQRQWQRMASYEREAAMEEMKTDVENLMIAWRYWFAGGDLEQLQKMVNGIWLLYDGQGWYQAILELTRDLLNILSATPSSPEQAQQEIMLQTSLARALLAIKGYTSEVEEAYTQALKLSEGLGEIPQLFPVLRGLSSYYMYRAEFDKGAQIGKRILALAESRNDDNLRVHGYLVLGANSGFFEGYHAGLEILDQGIALFEREQSSLRPFQLGNNPGIVCYTTSAFFLWWLGFPDRAVDRAYKAIEAATNLNHPFTMAYALFHTGSLHMWRGEIALANQRAKAMLAVAQEHGFQIWDSLATMLLGATEMSMGDIDGGFTKIEQGFSLYQGFKSPPVFYPYLIAMRAEAHARAGRPAEGLHLLEGVFKDIDEKRLLREMPPLFILKSELMYAVSPDNLPEAISILQQILDDAGHQGGLATALQAATSLCKLEMLAGDAKESGQRLTEIYDSFTEGFDTTDLQRAKAVLDDWRG